MNPADHESLLTLARRQTLGLLDAVAGVAASGEVLRWRPGPGRAHLAWQFMHIAATEDKHLNVRMLGREPREPDWVRRFASGSVPDDDVPSIEVIRRYLEERREELLAQLRGLSAEAFTTKPNAAAPYVYRDWFQVLALHEAYHHGQAHLTYNLYCATHDQGLPRVGH